MIRKSTLLAVAASAALGLAMLSPTDASARGHGGGGGGGGCTAAATAVACMAAATAAECAWSAAVIGGRSHIGFRHCHPHWHVRYHRPIWYGVRPVLHRLQRARCRVAGPCTCLSKEYTPDGAVLFKDRCTNEAAMNPPAWRRSRPVRSMRRCSRRQCGQYRRHRRTRCRRWTR